MRITIKMLETRIGYLNRLTGNPETPWTRKDGKLAANIGNFHLSQAYGGTTLHRMDTDGGGISCPIDAGYATKGLLWEQLNAFIGGIEYARRG